VKPENILVVSNGATYPHEWQFKLADLGISHFKRRRPPLREDSAASDTYGTKTYGSKPISFVTLVPLC
jgi:serine/threonine protein kinase